MLTSPPLIAPSLLSANFLDLQDDIQRVSQAGADWLHIDVMDGHYVPNLSFGPEWVKQIRKVTSLPLDVHLMVTCVDKCVDDFAVAGADHITVHPDATYHPYRCLQKIKQLGLKAGVALNPGSSLNVIYPLLDQLDVILIMTVNPGFGGQKFLPGVVPKIKALRTLLDKEKLDISIVVDGGINDQTAPSVIEAGANVLVAGNYLFGNHPETLADRLSKLRLDRPEGNLFC